ncbi:MAG: hypothetical protein WBG73_07670 [Coleofasciculaceae cyanobacterium]
MVIVTNELPHCADAGVVQRCWNSAIAHLSLNTGNTTVAASCYNRGLFTHD